MGQFSVKITPLPGSLPSANQHSCPSSRGMAAHDPVERVPTIAWNRCPPSVECAPKIIRVDNGPEYISGKLLIWAGKHGITIQHIQPGQPQQNAYIERYNRTVRHEWLDQYIIESIDEAQEHSTQWLCVTSRQVVWLFSEQVRLECVPVLHRLQGRLAAQR